MTSYTRPEFVPLRQLAEAVHEDFDHLDKLVRHGLIRGQREFVTSGEWLVDVESYIEYHRGRKAAGDTARDGVTALEEFARNHEPYFGHIPGGRR